MQYLESQILEIEVVRCRTKQNRSRKSRQSVLQKQCIP